MFAFFMCHTVSLAKCVQPTISWFFLTCSNIHTKYIQQAGSLTQFILKFILGSFPLIATSSKKRGFSFFLYFFFFVIFCDWKKQSSGNWKRWAFRSIWGIFQGYNPYRFLVKMGVINSNTPCGISGIFGSGRL